MKTIAMLTKRNILLYIRNRSAVFFSLFSMIIIILLNLVFLGKLNVDQVMEMTKTTKENAEYLINSWLMAGIIVVNSVTVTLGVVGIMIQDEESKTILSFWVSPVNRIKLILGYVFAAIIIGCIMCFMTFALSEIYIVCTGGTALECMSIIKALIFIMVIVFSSTCMVFFMSIFVHSNSAFSGLSTIVGTLVGFVGGIYLPMGNFPDIIQKILKCFPIVYGTAVMREIFSEKPINIVFDNIDESIITGYKEYMGIIVSIDDVWVNNAVKIAILLGSGLIFMTCSFIILKNRQIKDR